MPLVVGKRDGFFVGFLVGNLEGLFDNGDLVFRKVGYKLGDFVLLGERVGKTVG